MADLRITELEFEQIKQNFVKYLETQSEFSDYNFAGSGLNVLLDVLAYNTHYNAILAHLMSNEMFIDTAQKRSSVVSIAKTLGYTPRSNSAATAVVEVQLESSSAGPLTLNKNTKFSSTVNGKALTFVTVDTYRANKIDGVFTFNNVILKQGSYITQNTTIDPTNLSGPITISNSDIDISTILVTVQNSASDSTTTVFTNTTTVIDISGTDQVYWLEEGQNGFYTIIFGDNVIGKALTAGNIVTISYVATYGPDGNSASTFSCQQQIAGDTPVTTTIATASGGSLRETIDSIRFNAPRFNSTRDRAVTIDDYKSIILRNFDKAKSVAVWGGEQNIPPIYGKVFMSVDPKTDYIITDLDKEYLINQVLRPRSVLSILHEFVDPIYLYVGMDVNVTYNAHKTPFTSAQIESIVNKEITNYFTNELSTLEKRFYYAQLINKIQISHRAILGSLIDIHLQRRITPLLNIPENINLYFTTEIEPNSIRSTKFKTKIEGLTYLAYIQDFPDTSPPSKTGTGTLKLLNAENDQVIIDNYGEVFYSNSGLLKIPRLYVTELVGATTDLRFYAYPQDLSKDLNPTIIRTTTESTQAIYPYPSQNVIVVLDDSQISKSIGTIAGLTITAEATDI